MVGVNFSQMVRSKESIYEGRDLSAFAMFYSAEFGKSRKDASIFDDGQYGGDVAPCR